jgi:Predicted periplasmic or secreted lipoprotein
VHVNVTSYNRAVLLTGEVPDDATKQKISDIAKNVGNVKSVTNELVIAPPALLSARTNDTYITTKVKPGLSMPSASRLPRSRW